MPTATQTRPNRTASPHSRPLPTAIASRLGQTKTKLRLIDLGIGLARSLLVLSISLVGVFLLDVILEPPLAVVQLFALFVTMLAVGITFYLVIKPFRRRLDEDTIALLLEAEFPEFEGGLISSVQLLRDADHFTSVELVEQTVNQAADRVAALDLGRVVRLGALLPLWVLLVGFTGSCAALLSNEDVASYAKIFSQRLIEGQPLGYPKLIGFQVVKFDEVARLVTEEELAPVTRIAKGEDFNLRVKITKGVSLLDELTVVTELANGKIEIRELHKTSDGFGFARLYQNVTAPFKFRVVAPGHGVKSVVYAIEVVQRPRIERYEFVLRYPAYVGRAPEALGVTRLEVPSGTLISYVAVANKPLRRADLLIETSAAGAGRSTPGATRPMKLGTAPVYLGDVQAADLISAGPEGDAPDGAWSELSGTLARFGVTSSADGRRVLLGRFVARQDTKFQFDLLSEEGQQTGSQPVRFSIAVVPDKRPVISIPIPGGERQVTPQAKVDLMVNARDDYGLKHVELRLRVVRGANQEPWKKITLELPDDVDREAKLPYGISLADYRVAPGDRIEYMAVAFDFNTEANRPPGSSRRYVLRIGAPEDLERMFQDRLAALKERLVSAVRDQEEARKGSQSFSRELGPKSVLSEDDKRRVKRLEYEQRRVTTRLRDVGKALKSLAKDRKANRLTEKGAMSMLRDLSKGVSKLAEERSPQIERKLADARKAESLDAKTKAALRQVPDLQQSLADDLRRLATRIDKWGDFTEVIQELRDLLKGEEQVIDGADRAAAERNR
ncbi:MAG: hypothetical protein JKY65_02655 [Planctomycetes bacterium]|nr:hypothetical protein [Planctomycetota bacterium]